ncbi:cation:proton antiporter [Kocuria rhizosphaericola]|uniref:cation:proton antiporter n=1 Tax=Kocuria rhizosphaericola TaxID=3376284 RepID=UPI0037A3816B
MVFDPVLHEHLWMSVAGQVLIVLGSLVFLTAMVGLVRLPDLYTRSSAVATAAGVGIALILLGVFFFVPGVTTAIKLVAAVLLQLVTSSVGAMAVVRSGYLIGSAVYSPTHHNELEERTEWAPDPGMEDRS